MARWYALYRLCRTMDLVPMELPKGKKMRYEVIQWPTGYHALPEVGGVLDQSLYGMMLFEQFISGERTAAIKRISK